MNRTDWIDYLQDFRDKYQFHEAVSISHKGTVIIVRYDHNRTCNQNRYIPFIYDGKQVVIQNETK